ncbi:hypothetical protein L596_024662 [Steinernema carpocapsae]|uniref:Uncharacterized protein n=1 Tax=Steinernema carpocapsae TaxID=34508 RepID=A0A4U5M5E1_STECR|nr:hypothetical protein L596_024662 [Steinernema carpocapsae]
MSTLNLRLKFVSKLQIKIKASISFFETYPHHQPPSNKVLLTFLSSDTVLDSTENSTNTVQGRSCYKLPTALASSVQLLS